MFARPHLRFPQRSRALGALLTLTVASGLLAACDSAGGQSATPRPDDSLVYVAMGDSYTAAPLFPLQEKEVIGSCLRSDENYPVLLAAEVGAELLDVSCSGASTTSMFFEQRFPDASEPPQPPQLDALNADVDLVTIGIGANDYQFFSKMIFTCLRIAFRNPEGAPCRAAFRDQAGRDELAHSLTVIETNVETVVAEIRRRAPQARIVLVGYPQLLPNEGTCKNRLPLATGDYAYTRDLNVRLSEAVERGGTAAGAEYLDLVAASQGHDICSDEPWVAGVRGDPERAMGLHPYPAEQRAVAALIVGML